jgi:hypothetical protein
MFWLRLNNINANCLESIALTIYKLYELIIKKHFDDNYFFSKAATVKSLTNNINVALFICVIYIFLKIYYY